MSNYTRIWSPTRPWDTSSEGEWDRRVEEFEGSALGGGGYGEQVEAGLVVAGDA
jgi:hypothetical protein